MEGKRKPGGVKPVEPKSRPEPRSPAKDPATYSAPEPSESGLNKTVIIAPSKEQKQLAHQIRPKVKEDPGPMKSVMIDWKKTLVKSVKDNKKRLEERQRWSRKGLDDDAEELLLARDQQNITSAYYFPLSLEDIMQGLVKQPYSPETETLLDVLKYMHQQGLERSQLIRDEQPLRFQYKPSLVEEQEVVQQLRGDVTRLAGEVRRWQEQAATLGGEKRKAEEQQARLSAEVDARGKKIAELTYNLRCANQQLLESRKMLVEQGRQLSEIKGMYGREQATAIKSLASLRSENAQLHERLEEEQTEKSQLQQTCDRIQQELTAHLHKEEEALPAVSNPLPPPVERTNFKTLLSHQGVRIQVMGRCIVR
jgi:hypothetical protein